MQQPLHCPWTSKLPSFLSAMFTSASFPALAESPGSHLRAIKKQHEICNCVELFACLCGDMLLELPGGPEPDPEPHCTLGSRRGSSGQ